MTYQSFPYHIEEIHLESNKKLLSKIVSCWQQSVEATHDFLTQTDIEHIARYVPDAIKSVTHLAVCFKDSKMSNECDSGRLSNSFHTNCNQTNNDESNESDYVVGFIGIEKAMIEMLFINPVFRGQGIGTTLLDYAIQKYNPTFVDVNEQNKQAVVFYEQYGFIVTGRSETDAMGDPFPILHMQLRKDSRSN